MARRIPSLSGLLKKFVFFREDDHASQHCVTNKSVEDSSTMDDAMREQISHKAKRWLSSPGLRPPE
jgi:hypothetical protein